MYSAIPRALRSSRLFNKHSRSFVSRHPVLLIVLVLMAALLAAVIGGPIAGAVAASFGAKTDFGTGSGPISVAVGDFNGDGRLDLAVANQNSATVSILLGTGTGSFGAKTDFGTGSVPVSVAVGDFNGDGQLDLAVANFGSNTVSILLGTGTGSFGAKTDFGTGSSPVSVAVGDFNGDGQLDLAVANSNSTTVSILLGTGTGSFGAKTDFGTGSSPVSVAVGDFNGNGQLDLAVANFNSTTVSILLGTGTGSFGAKTDFGTGSSPRSVAVGDFNGDGQLDLAVANFNSTTVSILLGTGTGSFGAKTDFGTGSGPFSVAVGDFNGDGQLDLAVANRGSSTVSILLGTGTGSFGAKTDFGTGSLPFSVAVGDFNGDGKLDLAVANFNSNTVSILLNTTPIVASGVFCPKTDFGTGSFPRSVAVGDFNGDGRLDLAVANANSVTVSILLGTGTGSFGAKTDFGTGSVPQSVAVGDFNGDGKLDLAVANQGSDTVSILLGTGTGSFGAKTDFGTGSQPISVAVGDFNGDGKLDLAVANSASATVSILLGTGTGSFGAKTDFGTGVQPISVAVGDFNGDGKLDLAVANFSSTVSILLGTGTGSFGAKTDFGTGNQPRSVAVGDFNGDGRLDLAVANFNDNTVSILLGTGTGSFGAKTDFGTGSIPFSVAVGDFNGDGKLDLAVANANSATVSILLGTGTGSFGAKADFGTDGGPESVAVGEFNRDGKLDLAVANFSSNNVSILLNNTPPTPTITPSGTATFCVSGTLTSSSSTGNQWYKDNNLLAGETNQTLNVTASGSYTVTVTDSSCPSAPSAATTVTVNPTPATPTITPGGPTTFCQGNSVTLTSSSASGNQWYLNGNPIGGETNQTYVASATGNYTVQMTDGNNCQSSPSGATSVTVNPIPPTPTITPSGSTTACDSLLLTSSSASGNQWYKDNVLLPGQTNSTYNATASGSYTVTVTNGSGCSAASAPTTVTVQPTAITVINASDSGAGSLRQAIADACSSGATINFDTSGVFATSQTITLTSGELIVNKNVTITGPGANSLTVSGNQSSRVFKVGSGVTAVISGLTVANGKVINSAFGGGIYIDAGGTLTLTDSTLSGNSSSTSGGLTSGGGGIANLGTLTITNSTLSGNFASGGSFGSSGGGIQNSGTVTITNSTLSGNSASDGGPGNVGGGIQNSGTVTITNSTLSGNFVSGGAGGSGGGILNTGAGTLTITNSTLSGNFASSSGGTSFGGAITSGGGSTTLTITNSTISGNSVSGGSDQGGGIFNGGTVNIRSTIIAQNTATTSGPDVQGTFTSQGHNLIGNTSGATITGDTTGNILNQNPQLGPLQNNGGPTLTMALLAGSPAINAGDDCVFVNSCSPVLASALTTDQRGFTRKAGAHVDIGAVEVNYALVATAGNNQTAATNTAFGTQLQATVTESGVNQSGISVTFTAPGSGASGTFQGTGTNTATVTTNSSGVATAPVFTANAAGGSYSVIASIGTGLPTAGFNLTNAPPPTLGNYPNTSVGLGASANITPDAAPTNTTGINVSTSTNFKGVLSANSATGVVSVTNASPAGAFTVKVTAFNSTGGTTSKTFQLTVHPGTACAGVSTFNNAADLNIGAKQVAAAIGDFNNDGKQDIATVDQGNIVSIRLGDGMGGFTGSTNVSVGLNPQSSLAIGDFNSDGNQDFATANLNANTVSIRLGDGVGGFTGSTEVSVGNGPTRVAVGDFNNDGKQDLAVAHLNSPSGVSIRLGDGAGGFTGSTNITVGFSVLWVAIGDFNNDGKQDIATANPDSDNVSIRLGDGTGAFTGSTNIGVGDRPTTVTIGDFNNDGKQDLAATNSFSDDVSIRLGDGAGGFTGSTNIGVGDFPLSVAVGDFNNDGKQDFAADNFDSNTVSIRLGDGLGAFTGSTNISVGSSPYPIAIGDFNNDGKQDFVAPSGDLNTASVRLGGCNLTPAITAAPGLSRQQGSPASNSQIATVTDDGGNGNVIPAVISANPSNGVTISNIINTGGNVTANIIASCAATNASFTLQASDGVSTSTATLNVTVNANTAPALTYTNPPAVNFNGSTTVTPATATDNGSITGYSVQSVVPALTTTPTVNSSGLVSITNAQPAGTHTITIRATDNCGLTTDASFTLTVNKANTATALASSINPSDFGQSVTFTATVTSGAGTPPGTVQFKDNGNNLGAAVALNPSSVAQVSTSTLTVGTHTITAEYSGDANFATSTGTLTGGQVVKAQPTLSINDVSIAEGDSGTTAMSFTVTLSAASNLTATVDFATANGTAITPDYLATNGTLTFNPGDLTKTIIVTINGDVNFESDETFTVNLTNAINAGISKGSGTGTIQNDDPAGGVIAMSKTDDTVSEATGFITVTVVRTKDVSQAVNVDYATDDTGASTNCATLNGGLASSRCDFTLMLGTLRFAANETQKTVDIPINRDGHLEGAEIFKFVLSNPTGGAILGASSSLNITINDSVVPSANAIDDTDLFVRQQYHDFLNREPDAAGLAFWKDNIDKCMDPTRIPAGQTAAQCLETQRVITSAAFFLSIEFRQTGGLVRDFYVASLDRPATNNMPNLIEFTRDTQAIQKGVVVGQGNWQAQLAANQTAFMDDFVTRAEFVGLYPTTDTPTQYVDKLYLHANVTPGSAQERNNAIAEFGGAATAANAGARGRALLRITQNAAFQARELNRAFVQMEYFGYLRRNPNDAPDNNFNGYNFWLNKLNQFNGDFLKAEMVKAFLSSDEYRRRFGP